MWPVREILWDERVSHSIKTLIGLTQGTELYSVLRKTISRPTSESTLPEIRRGSRGSASGKEIEALEI